MQSKVEINSDDLFLKGVNPTHFYKYGNLPIKGVNSGFLIPKDAAPHEDLQQNYYPHLVTIKLWEPEDLKLYDSIMNKIGKGWAILRYEQVQWVESKENWMILLAYCDAVLEKPTQAPFLGEQTLTAGSEKKVYGKVRRKKASNV